MKTDRELLELAARAYGFELKYNYLGGLDARQNWNPLEDDGDAFRLAVKLDIHLSLYGQETGMNAWVIGDAAESFDEDYGDDPCASARRAIVRAAAAIQEAKQEQSA